MKYGSPRKCLIKLALSSAFLVSCSAFADIDKESQDVLNSSLRQAARVGKVSEVESLIRKGADVNGQAPYGETALLLSVIFGHTETALLLIQLGANPNLAETEMNKTPLLKAAEDCNSKAVKGLLSPRAKVPADVNHPDNFGQTALINAVKSNCVKVVDAILELRRGKVKVNAMDNSFRTASEYARHPWIIGMLDEAQGKEVDKESLPPKFLP